MFTEKANVICYHCACKVPNSEYCFNCGKKINLAFSGLYNAISNPVHQHKNVSHIDQTEYKQNRYKTGVGPDTPAWQTSEWLSRYSLPSGRTSAQTPSGDNNEFIKKYQQREYFDRGLQPQSIKPQNKAPAKKAPAPLTILFLIIFILITMGPKLLELLNALLA